MPVVKDLYTGEEFDLGYAGPNYRNLFQPGPFDFLNAQLPEDIQNRFMILCGMSPVKQQGPSLSSNTLQPRVRKLNILLQEIFLQVEYLKGIRVLLRSDLTRWSLRDVEQAEQERLN